MTRIIRPIRIEGNTAYVPLTHGCEAVIDAEDVNLVEGHNWHALIQGDCVYAGCRILIDGKPKTLKLHRAIQTLRQGNETLWVDGDRLNNRKENLRQVPRFSKQRSVRHAANTSGFPGVYWAAGNSKWTAQILLGKTRKKLGSYDMPEEAYWAYCRALENYYKNL
ncbi:MAG: hypothetical protein ACK5X3_21690 [Pseudomonadota bacterium]|jgi:hypothetical protein